MSSSIFDLALKDILNVRNHLNGKMPTREQYFGTKGKRALGKYSWEVIRLHFKTWLNFYNLAFREPIAEPKREPKILLFDIETSYITAKVWRLGEQVVRHDQIEKDWAILSWAAKWRGQKELMYMDQRDKKNPLNDKHLVSKMWKLLDQADIVITKNGKRFDCPKLNARFAVHRLGSPSPYAHRDIEQMSRSKFAFSSHSLEYLCQVLGVKHAKSKHKKFPGRELWDECLAGNPEAWEEMKLYNGLDVLASEEVYDILAEFGIPGIPTNRFTGSTTFGCPEGHTDFKKKGFHFTAAGKFQRYQCKVCKLWFQESGAKNNLFSEKKKDSFRGA